MLINLEVEPAALSTLDPLLLSARISELLRSHRKGFHLVVIKRITAQWLLEVVDLAQRDKATLRLLMQEITQTGDLLRRARHYIRIADSSNSIIRRDARTVDMGLAFSHFDEVISAPVFVVEDIDDDLNLLKFIFATLGRRLVGPSHKYTARHGGGASTVRVAENHLHYKTIVVAAVDSDKQAPCAPDTKLEQMQRIYDRNGWPLFFFSQTPCRELENFIPLDVAAHLQACKASETFTTLIEKSDYERSLADQPNSDEFWLWFDIKRGVSGETLACIRNEAVLRWYAEKLTSMGVDTVSVVLGGFGPNFVRECVESSHIARELRGSIKSPRWLNVFGDYIENFLWIFLASQETRT